MARNLKQKILLSTISLVFAGVLGYQFLPLGGEDFSIGSSYEQPEPEPAPQTDHYQRALQFGLSAAQRTQTADSRSTWLDVRNRWNLAIRELETIPPDHPDHTIAQAKLTEYRANRDYAIAQAGPDTNSPLYRFDSLLTEADPNRELVASAALAPDNSRELVLVLTPSWQLLPHATRQQLATQFQQRWAHILGGNPDDAHLTLRNQAGQRIGGSTWSGTLVNAD